MMTVRSILVLCILASLIPSAFSGIYVYNNENRLVEDYDDQAASFGPGFTSDGIKGYVALTSPKNACTKVAPAPNISIGGYQWIALIPRTNSVDLCDFDLKVLNAQNANFSAVIIYNYDDSLIAMGTHGRKIQIPSTLITHSDGLSIISSYLYNKTSPRSTPQFHIRITGEQLFDFRAYLVPFLSIMGLLSLGFVVFLVKRQMKLIKCYLQRRRTRRHRLPRSALKQLKIKKFVKGDRWEVCAICLDDFEDGAKLRILPCDHAYHMKCIDPWLLNNRRQCPVCKRYVFPNHDHSDEESNDHAATERTPLIHPPNDDAAVDPSRSSQTEYQAGQSFAANYTHAGNETSDAEENDGEDISVLPRQSTVNRITTTDLVFDQRQSTSHRYSHPQLPRIILRQSSTEGQNSNNNTTTTSYGSFHDSPTGSFTTPRAANFFVGSLGGTTDNTNISARSVIESVSDVETDDNDERMHSVLTDVGINDAYVPDEGTADVLRTNL